jgi:hypothetical protein
MSPDWNAIRLDLLGIDEPMRAKLREMRPFFSKALPGTLARFSEKVRHYDPLRCQARAIAWRPLKVRRLGSFTPAI